MKTSTSFTLHAQTTSDLPPAQSAVAIKQPRGSLAESKGPLNQP